MKYIRCVACWGLENRMSLVRIIEPPTCSLKSTRFDIPLSGADLVPCHTMAGIIGAGVWGIETNAEIPIPPDKKGIVLPTNLILAFERFTA